MEEILCEGFEVTGHVTRQRRRTRNESDRIHAEARTLQTRRILAWRRKIPRYTRFPFDPAPVQGLHECRPYLMYTAVAPAFRDKASARSKRAVNRRHHQVRV